MKNSTIKTNKFAANCGNCNTRVAPGEGSLHRIDGRWVVACLDKGCTARGDEFHKDPALNEIEAIKADFDMEIKPVRERIAKEVAEGYDPGNAGEELMAVEEMIFEQVLSEHGHTFASYTNLCKAVK